MFISIRTYPSVRDMAELVRRGNEGLLPLVRKQPGFQAYYFAAAEDGSGRSISCFDSAEQSSAAYENIRSWVMKNVADLVSGTPRIEQGEDQSDRPPHRTGDAYISFVSIEGAPPAEQVLPQMRAKVMPVVMNDPATLGFHSCRDQANTSHVAGAYFYADAANGKRIEQQVLELVGKDLPQLFPKPIRFVGAQLLTSAVR